ncbi:MAG: hypothetical protein QG597_3563 [Actinomycetota bacterium]|nr:hypothetical protein [Actinomycetota bacterium]
MTGLAQHRDHSAESERRRLSLLVRIAATAGDFSPKLATAVDRATDAEVQVMSDLVDIGLSIPDLVHLLQGAHLLVGDDELYLKWIFPHSRKRLSSHHRTMDKEVTPDYGLDGPLVRESLHGKAPFGTWVQLERTKATFQKGKMPSWHDVVHIKDYVIYRITGKNVGPWGLSAHVDTRPMFLRPPYTAPGEGAREGLAGFTARRLAVAELDNDDAAAWSDLLSPDVETVGPAGDLFLPPDPPEPDDLLPPEPFLDELGPGLFGSLAIVQQRATLPPAALPELRTPVTERTTVTPEPGDRTITVRLGKQTVTIPVAIHPITSAPLFIGLEND